MLGYEFVDILVKLFYEKSIELILFRNQLYDRSASVILFLHSYAVHTIGKVLRIQDSLVLAKALAEMDIPPARIDIGRLNFEWTVRNMPGPKPSSTISSNRSLTRTRHSQNHVMPCCMDLDELEGWWQGR